MPVSILPYTAFYTIIDVLECASNPCLNGATCNEYVNYYNCTCAAGFSGATCNISMLLFSNRQLSLTLLRLILSKINFFTSSKIDKLKLFNNLLDFDECASNPCQHQYATCTDGANSYTCTCPSDWTGTHCEIGQYAINNQLSYLTN